MKNARTIIRSLLMMSLLAVAAMANAQPQDGMGDASNQQILATLTGDFQPALDNANVTDSGNDAIYEWKTLNDIADPDGTTSEDFNDQGDAVDGWITHELGRDTENPIDPEGELTYGAAVEAPYMAERDPQEDRKEITLQEFASIDGVEAQTPDQAVEYGMLEEKDTILTWGLISVDSTAKETIGPNNQIPDVNEQEKQGDGGTVPDNNLTSAIDPEDREQVNDLAVDVTDKQFDSGVKEGDQVADLEEELTNGPDGQTAEAIVQDTWQAEAIVQQDGRTPDADNSKGDATVLTDNHIQDQAILEPVTDQGKDLTDDLEEEVNSADDAARSDMTEPDMSGDVEAIRTQHLNSPDDTNEEEITITPNDQFNF